MSGAFHGSVALVTGAGRGLGEAIARMLTREGATVICCDRNAEAVAALAAETTVRHTPQTSGSNTSAQSRISRALIAGSPRGCTASRVPAGRP